MKLILKYFLYVIILIINILNIYAQQIHTWDLVSQFNYYPGTSFNVVQVTHDKIAASDSRTLVAFSQDSSFLIGLANIVHPTIVYSNDDGLNWKVIRNDTTDFMNDFDYIIHPTKNLIIVTGDTINSTMDNFRAFLLITRDCGASWEKIFLDSNSYISNFSMIDSLNGALIKTSFDGISYNDSIYITNDAWRTWKSQATPNNIGYTYQIVFINNENYFLCTFTNEFKFNIYRTFDGGNNWIKSDLEQLTEANYSVLKLIYYNDNFIWFCGGFRKNENNYSNMLLLKSTNGGLSWVEKQLDTFDPYNVIYDLEFFNNENKEGIIITNDKIYRTIDSGNTWIREYFNYTLPLNSYFLKNILSIGSDNYLYLENISTQQCMLYKSSINKSLSPPYIIPETYSSDFIKLPDKAIVKWKKVEGATKYRFQLGFSDTFPNAPIGDSTIFNYPALDTVVSDTIIEIKSLQYNKFYAERAKSLNDTQESDWYININNYLQTIAYKGQLLPLRVTTPFSMQHIFSEYLTVNWEAVDNASSYNFILYENIITPNLIRYRDSVTSGTSYTIPYYLNKSVVYILRAYYKIGDSTSIYNDIVFITKMNPTDVIEQQNYVIKNNVITFPNPFNDMLNISFEKFIDIEINIEIFDIIGNRLKSSKFSGLKDFYINTSDFNTGVYFLNIIIEGESNTYKIMKIE